MDLEGSTGPHEKLTQLGHPDLKLHTHCKNEALKSCISALMTTSEVTDKIETAY